MLVLYTYLSIIQFSWYSVVVFFVGERLGERVVVKHIVPAVRSIILSGLEVSCQGMVGPAQSWRLLAIVDALAVLDRLILFLPPSTVLSELLQVCSLFTVYKGYNM